MDVFKNSVFCTSIQQTMSQTKMLCVKLQHQSWYYTIYINTTNSTTPTLPRLKQIICDKLNKNEPLQLYAVQNSSKNKNKPESIINNEDVLQKIFKPATPPTIIAKFNQPGATKINFKTSIRALSLDSLSLGKNDTLINCPHTDSLIWSRILRGPHAIEPNGYCPNCKKVWKFMSRNSSTVNIGHALAHIEKRHESIWRYYTFSFSLYR